MFALANTLHNYRQEKDITLHDASEMSGLTMLEIDIMKNISELRPLKGKMPIFPGC